MEMGINLLLLIGCMLATGLVIIALVVSSGK